MPGSGMFQAGAVEREGVSDGDTDPEGFRTDHQPNSLQPIDLSIAIPTPMSAGLAVKGGHSNKVVSTRAPRGSSFSLYS